MANKTVFGSSVVSDVVQNLAGGKGYKMTDEHALVQLAVTGTLQDVFYATAKDQADQIIALASKLPAEFVAKVAVYARTRGFMKDTPALLMCVLASREDGKEAFRKAFPRVINNAKMLRNFVQILRSGKTGRKNLGSMPRRAVQTWLNGASDKALLNASVGQSPSLKDIIKLSHPKGATPERVALYGYLTDGKYDSYKLPDFVQAFEDFKVVPEGDVPDVDFRLLSNLTLTEKQWGQKALQLPVEALRMNINQLARKGAFNDSKVVAGVCAKLRDREAVRAAGTMPVAVLTAYHNLDDTVPAAVKNALHDMMEITVENVPSFGDKKVAILVDVSGSMGSPMTNGKHTSKTRYVDIAAAVGCSIWRQNPNAQLIPIDTSVHTHKMSARDSILNNAGVLARFGGGGTSLDVALAHVKASAPDVVVILSDNESWADLTATGSWHSGYGGSRASMGDRWRDLVAANPNAKLICVDLAPYSDLTNKDSTNVLNLGGWTDEMFPLIASFVNGDQTKWVDAVKAVSL